MTEPITPLAIPDGCDRCPNRLPVQRNFLFVTKSNIYALILALGLIPCYFEQGENGQFRLSKQPNLALITIILPVMGLALGIDIIPKPKA